MSNQPTSGVPKFCLSCNYLLEGLEIDRCPECGQEFDPRDPTTFWIPENRPRLLIPLVHCASIAIFALLMMDLIWFGCLIRLGRAIDHRLFLPVILILGLGTTTTAVATGIALVWRNRHSHRFLSIPAQFTFAIATISLSFMLMVALNDGLQIRFTPIILSILWFTPATIWLTASLAIRHNLPHLWLVDVTLTATLAILAGAVMKLIKSGGIRRTVFADIVQRADPSEALIVAFICAVCLSTPLWIRGVTRRTSFIICAAVLFLGWLAMPNMAH